MTKYFIAIHFILASVICLAQSTQDSIHISENAKIELTKLMEDEDWIAVASKAFNLLQQFQNDTSDFHYRLNYDFIVASAAKTSQEKMSYEELSEVSNDFVGKKVVLPQWPIGGKNLYCFKTYCPSGRKGYDIFSVASNREDTYMFAMIYANTGTRLNLEKDSGRHAILRGTIKAVEPNPNKSLAMILWIYLDPATIEFYD